MILTYLFCIPLFENYHFFIFQKNKTACKGINICIIMYTKLLQYYLRFFWALHPIIEKRYIHPR